MKNCYKSALVFVFLLQILSTAAQAQNSVGIGTTIPNNNAVLELVSPGNNQGFLVPRVTTAQRMDNGFVSNLSSSDNGLLVFDSDVNSFYFWEISTWRPIGALAGGSQDLQLTGNTLTLTNGSASVDLSTYLQVISVNRSGNDVTLDISNGNSIVIDVGDGDSDPSNEIQDLASVLAQGGDAGGSILTNISDPVSSSDAATKNYVDNVNLDNNPLNEIQNVSISGNRIEIDGGGTGADLSAIAPAAGEVLKWNGTTWQSGLDLTAAGSTLPTLGNAQLVTNNGSNVAVTVSGDVAMNNAGVMSIQSGAVDAGKIANNTITDTQINSGANIAASKLNASVMVESENISLLNNNAGYIANISGFDTDDLGEGGANLYYTNARFDSRFASSSVAGLSDISSAGSGQVITAAERTLIGSALQGIGALSTDDLSEGGSNLYYTDARVDARLASNSVTSLGDVSSAGSGIIISAAERNQISTNTSDISSLQSTGINSSQLPNLVYAGPPTAPASAPVFRSLVANDIPNLDASKITSGALAVANGGTNSSAIGAAGTIAYTNGTSYLFTAAGTAGQVLSSNGAGAPTWVDDAFGWGTSGNAGTTPGTGGGQNYIGSSDAQDLVLATNSVERMRINQGTGDISLGSVQAGLNTPVFPSHRFITLSSDDIGFIGSSMSLELSGYSSGLLSEFARIDFNATASSSSNLIARIAAYRGGTVNRGELRIGTHNGTAFTNHMVVTEDGDFGFGTMSPGTKVDISGTLRTTGFQLSTTPTVGHVLTANASGVGTWQVIPAQFNVTNNVPKGDGAGLVGSAIYSDGTNQVGLNQPSPTAGVHSTHNNGALFQGTYGGGSIPSTAVGARMMWYPRKAAFFAGRMTTANDALDANIGNYSVSLGFDGLANGEAAVSIGYNNNVTGNRSVGLGNANTVTSDFAYSFGWINTSSGLGSVSLGYGANSSADEAVTLGRYITSSGVGSYTIGSGVTNLSRLTNGIDDSFMVGMNSTVPTLFVGGGIGGATYGDVGIATTSPLAQLDVRGNQNIGSGIIPAVNTSDNILNVQVGINSNGATNGVAFFENVGGFGMKLGYDGAGGGDNNKMAIYSNLDAEVITFENGGNLGLGVVNPVEKLEVDGNVSVVNGSITVANGDITIDNLRDVTNPANNYIGWDPAGELRLVAGLQTLVYGQTDGKVRIGTQFNSNSSRLLVQGFGNGTGIGLKVQSSLGTSNMEVLDNGRVGIRRTPTTYNLEVQGNAGKTTGGVDWVVLSDARLKKDINAFTDGLDQVLAVNPVTYRYNNLSVSGDTTTIYQGVLAQEIEKVFPYMVNETNDVVVDSDGKTFNPLHYDNSAMAFILVNAVKELNTKVVSLETKNEELEEKVKHLESEFGALLSEVQEIKAQLPTATLK